MTVNWQPANNLSQNIKSSLIKLAEQIRNEVVDCGRPIAIAVSPDQYQRLIDNGWILADGTPTCGLLDCDEPVIVDKRHDGI